MTPFAVSVLVPAFQVNCPTVVPEPLTYWQSYDEPGVRSNCDRLRFLVASVSNPPGTEPVVQAFNGPGWAVAYAFARLRVGFVRLGGVCETVDAYTLSPDVQA